jgi:hypothetical protein
LLRLSERRVGIFDQLLLEEALYRGSSANWCVPNDEHSNRGSNAFSCRAVVNVGNDPPAVVMGIGGKPHLLLDIPKVKASNTPVIRRFTGGGTVVVDKNTTFASIIGNFVRTLV